MGKIADILAETFESHHCLTGCLRNLPDCPGGAHREAATATDTRCQVDMGPAAGYGYGLSRACFGTLPTAGTESGCYRDQSYLLHVLPSEHGGVSHRSCLPQQVVPPVGRPPLVRTAGVEINLVSRPPPQSGHAPGSSSGPYSRTSQTFPHFSHLYSYMATCSPFCTELISLPIPHTTPRSRIRRRGGLPAPACGSRLR
jgi:hypothetical protein